MSISTHFWVFSTLHSKKMVRTRSAAEEKLYSEWGGASRWCSAAQVAT
jgi:hypothetical protein